MRVAFRLEQSQPLLGSVDRERVYGVGRATDHAVLFVAGADIGEHLGFDGGFQRGLIAGPLDHASVRLLRIDEDRAVVQCGDQGPLLHGAIFVRHVVEWVFRPGEHAPFRNGVALMPVDHGGHRQNVFFGDLRLVLDAGDRHVAKR